MEFSVPEPDPCPKTVHQLSFWLETNEGEAAIRLLDRDGKPLDPWSGRRGEMVITRRIPRGKYTLEIDASETTGGAAVFGVKGWIVPRCELDSATFQEHPALPDKGFYWPYLLFVPKEVKFPFLLVVPNNTGFPVEDLDDLRACASCEISGQSALAERLGCPLLLPIFPRPFATEEEGWNLDLHALTRASLLTCVNRWKRVDLQLLGMIQDAQNRLEAKGLKIKQKVLLSGFSASGSFVNRFTMLHPERVLAVACGSPGWPIAPVAEFGGDRLEYPVGIADVEDLTKSPIDIDALKSVRWFFFLGEDDTSDAVPHWDSFSKQDSELIFRRFGGKGQLRARWEVAERLYSLRGLQARFRLYPHVAHDVSPEMESDIALFFEECLKDAPERSRR